MEEKLFFYKTAWERKLREHRLKNEPRQIRAWREEAENPKTTGERLTYLYRQLSDYKINQEGNPTIAKEALARHPTTPPDVLLKLIEDSNMLFSGEYTGAFCENPVAPFLLLEMPDFVSRLNISYLLREESVPLPLLRSAAAQTKSNQGRYENEMGLHIALAGEIQTVSEGEAQIKAFWQNRIAYDAARLDEAVEDVGERRRRHKELNAILQINADMVELGLAPAWVNEPPLGVEPVAPELALEAKQWLEWKVAFDSPEEQDLWARIAPKFADRPELAACARAHADEEALVTLAKEPKSHTGCLHEVLAAHPNATPAVFTALFQSGTPPTRTSLHVVRLVATHLNASTELLTKLVQFQDAEVRRLARRHKNAPANALDLSRQALFGCWSKNLWGYRYWGYEKYEIRPFELFIGGLYGGLPLDWLHLCGTGWSSQLRLTAAFALPTEQTAFPNDEENMYADPSEAIEAGCTTLDLLQHLARDGNRLVRWAAQARLADPDYKFTWR